MNADQAARRAIVEAGGTVLANTRKGTDEALIAWAEERGVFEKIDRTTLFGNPFVTPRDGSRDVVCDLYREHLKADPSLQAALPSLRGKVLGCWCHPKRCHGGEIIDALQRRETCQNNARFFDTLDTNYLTPKNETFRTCETNETTGESTMGRPRKYPEGPGRFTFTMNPSDKAVIEAFARWYVYSTNRSLGVAEIMIEVLRRSPEFKAFEKTGRTAGPMFAQAAPVEKIGRASCRERV